MFHSGVSPSVQVHLPNGLWIAETCLQEAGLRPLNGFDEAQLLALRDTVTSARWTSELLVRCLTHIGTLQPLTLAAVQALTVGDREALLLHTHRLNFGERLLCVLACPACTAKLMLDLQVRDLLLPPGDAPGYWYRAPLPDSDLLATFRLPTGADQEAVADLTTHDAAAAALVLLERCLHSLSRAGTPVEASPAEIAPDVAQLISERDPQAELMLNSSCVECGQQFAALLDMGQYVAEEINHRLPYLYREVHLLAWHYHWSEADILRMTRSHRQIYLDLLDEALREVGR
ncbi:MAG: hypothetical protein EOM24_04055 [Chloroflexia bacterium]|nr:hypothetical protein [Chloroflexia bacterium]